MIPKQLEERIVRLHFVEKWPVGTIARHVGVHHTTVKRVLHHQGLRAATASRPSMVEPYLSFIHETLEAYPDLPASRLHEMVVERGYPGSQSHFRRLVATLRPRKPAEAFQRLSTLPGEEAQVDWASFGTVQVGAATRRLSAFVMVLSWSRMAAVHFFYEQRMGAFLEGHVRCLDVLGGVPRKVLYDNLKSAVLERRDDAIRFHPTLLSFAAHYRYEPRPVAVARGNEKGRVERFIRYLRTSFWPARTFDDLDDLNRQVALWCRRVAGARAHREEPELSVRRKLQDAEQMQPVLAAEGGRFITELFDTDEEAKQRGLVGDDLVAWRRKHAAPVLDRFRVWSDAVYPTLLPDAPLAKVIRYYRRHWTQLTVCLDHPVPLDNSGAERLFQPIAKLRHNCLFAGGPEGGHRAAVLLGIVATCQRLDVHVRAYLTWVFERRGTHRKHYELTAAELTPAAYKHSLASL